MGISVFIASNVSSVPSSGTPITHVLNLCSCHTVLGYSVLCFLVCFSLGFSVLEVSIDTFPSSQMLSSTMSSLLMRPSKSFFIISMTVFDF